MCCRAASLCDGLANEVVSMVHNIYSYDVFQPCFWGVQTHLAYLYNATQEYLAAEGIQWDDYAGAPSYEDTCDVRSPSCSLASFVRNLASCTKQRCVL